MDSVELVPETDHGILEMIGNFVQESMSGSEADLSDMFGASTSDAPATDAEPSLFEGAQRQSL